MNDYERAISEMSKEIIDNKRYSTLERVLKNYDYLVKKENNLEYPKRPYWEMDCWFGS